MKPKITREDLINEVRKEREEFSESLLPSPLDPVLAKIGTVGELGISEWYEVVYHNGSEWCCYAGSDTFNDGEHVIRWKYCSEIL